MHLEVFIVGRQRPVLGTVEEVDRRKLEPGFRPHKLEHFLLRGRHVLDRLRLRHLDGHFPSGFCRPLFLRPGALDGFLPALFPFDHQGVKPIAAVCAGASHPAAEVDQGKARGENKTDQPEHGEHDRRTGGIGVGDQKRGQRDAHDPSGREAASEKDVVMLLKRQKAAGANHQQEAATGGKGQGALRIVAVRKDMDGGQQQQRGDPERTDAEQADEQTADLGPDPPEQVLDLAGGGGVVNRRIPRAVGNQTEEGKNDEKKEKYADDFSAHQVPRLA